MKKSREMSRETYELIASHLHELDIDIEKGEIRNRVRQKPNVTGYIPFTIGGKTVLMHQVLAVARWGEGCIGMTVKYKTPDKTDLSSDNLQLVFHSTSTKLRGCQAKPKVRVKATNLKTGVTQEFASQGEASRVLHVSQPHISFVLKGLCPSAKGYSFERVVG